MSSTVTGVSATTLTFSTGAGSAGIGGGEGLAQPRLGEDIAVAPDILLNDQHAAGQYQTDGLRRVPGAQQKGLLGIAPLSLRRRQVSMAVSSSSETPEKS